MLVTHTYVNREVVRNARGNRPSFNGPGGVKANPTRKQLAAARGPHRGPTAAQRSRVAAAKNDPALHAKNNKGQPKAASVRDFERKHRTRAAERTATRQNQRGARRAGNQNSANATNRTANRSHARPGSEHVAASHARGESQARHNQSRRVANTSHATRHNDHATPHHERVASHHGHAATAP